MPLPWLLVFFMLFIGVFSISLYISSFYFPFPTINKLVKKVSPKIYW